MRAQAKQLCFYTGCWGLGFTTLWMVIYTIPHWDEIVTSEVVLVGGSPWLIVLLYATHTINNGVHNAAWFVVCELESGVSTGLLMGLKAAALFIASAVCFCKYQVISQSARTPRHAACLLRPRLCHQRACSKSLAQSPWPTLLDDHREQCMTTTKTAAIGIVLAGTALYYWPTREPAPLAELDGSRTGRRESIDVGQMASCGAMPSPGVRVATRPMGFKLSRFVDPSGMAIVRKQDFDALSARVDRLEAENRRLDASVKALTAEHANGTSPMAAKELPMVE